jgi:hypothetical protein
MNEFIMTGRLTLEGVVFYVTAENRANALDKAARGDYDSYDTDQADVVDWRISPNSIEENS